MVHSGCLSIKEVVVAHHPSENLVALQRMELTTKVSLTVILSVVSLLPLRSEGGLGMLYNQTFQTNNANITSDLWIANDSQELHDSEGSFYQQNISADLAGRGCFNMHSGWTDWQYQTTGVNKSKMFKDENIGWNMIPGGADTFNYSIPANQVVGWEDVNAEMEANAGTVPFDYTVPLTRSTTTVNGAPLGVLVNSGLATNGSSRATFEVASSNNWNSGSYLDWQKFLIGGSTNYLGGFDASIALTNGSPSISWSPCVSNRIYGIQSKTNLLDSVWIETVSVTNNSGSIDSYIVTNDMPSAFFKVDISLP